MVSPTYIWPIGGISVLPTVTSDADVPKPAVGVSAFYNSSDGVVRVKLTDGSTVDVGPAAAPVSTPITARAIAVFDGESATPGITFQQGNSDAHPGQDLFTGITRISPGVFDLATTISLTNAASVVAVTAQPTVAGAKSVIANYSITGSANLFVQLAIDDGTLSNANFSVIVFSQNG